jgi:hypothetical protein
MSDDIRYCANNCTRITETGRHPAHAHAGNLCASCINRLDRWLSEIPARYAEVPTYLEPGTSRDPDPDKRDSKRTSAPVPLRLDAVDLLDERRGRKWQGLVPTEERRGTLGTLLAIGNELRAMRGSHPKIDSTVIHEADYIRGGIERLALSDGIADIYTELRSLHRQLGDAIGDYPPKPIATCEVIDPNADTDGPCGGPILPSHGGGVYCPRCGTRYDVTELRRLGLVLGQKQQETA